MAEDIIAIAHDDDLHFIEDFVGPLVQVKMLEFILKFNRQCTCLEKADSR